MKIYRIEKDGIGPYHVGNGHFLDLQKYVNNDDWLISNCPTPFEDFSLHQHKFIFNKEMFYFDVKKDLKFAFPSLKALKRWFTPLARARLHNDGFKCVVYDIQNGMIKRTRKQVVFNSNSKSTIVKELSLKVL